MIKSLLNLLTDKKSTGRISALGCIREILFISPFKNSHQALDILIGYEDPNYVKIKCFYEP